MWWTALPNPGNPFLGGALLNIQENQGDDPRIVALPVRRLLQLNVTLANLINILMVNTLKGVEDRLNEKSAEQQVAELMADLDKFDAIDTKEEGTAE